MTLDQLGLTPVQIDANPAVTVGRAFTDTFAGIAPGSMPGFVVVQLAGLAVGLGVFVVLYPRSETRIDEAVVPQLSEGR